MTTEDALARYLTQRGIIEPGDDPESWYAARWFYTRVFGWKVPIFPMTGFRGGIAAHDLHHMITGYETNWGGECEVAGWELASGGCGPHAVFWLDRIGFFAIGLVTLPLRTLRAFRRGLGHRNLYGLDPARVLSMPFEEVEGIAGRCTLHDPQGEGSR